MPVIIKHMTSVVALRCIQDSYDCSSIKESSEFHTPYGDPLIKESSELYTLYGSSSIKESSELYTLYGSSSIKESSELHTHLRKFLDKRIFRTPHPLTEVPR